MKYNVKYTILIYPACGGAVTCPWTCWTTR